MLHGGGSRGVYQPNWYLHKDMGKTVLAKATFANDPSWCQQSFLVTTGLFWRKMSMCGRSEFCFLVKVAVWFCLFFLVFYFEKLFLRRERFVPCFIFSYGHDSGDHCGKAHFRHVI